MSPRFREQRERRGRRVGSWLADCPIVLYPPLPELPVIPFSAFTRPAPASSSFAPDPEGRPPRVSGRMSQTGSPDSRRWVLFATRPPPQLRQTLLRSLRTAGIKVRESAKPPVTGPGVIVIESETPSLLELVREVSRSGLERVIVVAPSRMVLAGDIVWSLLQVGASDAFAWDHWADPAVEIAARFERWEAVDDIVQSARVADSLVGQSAAWISVLRRVVEVARFTDAPVLITGESGTGKELVARLIHDLDNRPRKKAMVVLDCTTVVPTLSGSEFFGHEKGAFTGAIAAREGAFGLADGGTLFLDEVGELPLELQPELLRVIEEGMYKRVGSGTWRRTTFRLVCATNRDLLSEVTGGRFRRDLYYRLSGCAFHLPSLRERATDIPVLTDFFLRQSRPDLGEAKLEPEVGQLLLRREYQGNVRDLRQLVWQMSRNHVGPGPITPGDVPPQDRPAIDLLSERWSDSDLEDSIRRALSQRRSLKEITRAAADTAIRLALEQERWNLQRAALALGITDRALQLRRASRRLPLPAGVTSLSPQGDEAN